MKIAIIGTGNVGGALAKRFADTGHTVSLGVRDQNNFKGKELLGYSPAISALKILDAVKISEVIVLAVPALHAFESAKSLGNVTGKILIDTMNCVRVKLDSFTNTSDAMIAATQNPDVVKCFNTTGFENLLNPNYGGQPLDMFTAGSSEKARLVATELAKSIGFENVYHFGGNDRFELIEQMALCWINLAIMQKVGRDIGFKIIKRK